MSGEPVGAGQGLMDGRRRRTHASRERIVRAMLELIDEGDVSPSAEAVAARAGVGARSVFRHFANMETLYRELNRLMSAEIRPLAERPLNAETWEGRLVELIERRSAIFERIMPFKIAAEVHRHRSSFLAVQAAELAREQRVGVIHVLPKALRDETGLIEALDLVTSFEAWRRLRRDQRLTRPQARALVTQLAMTVIGGFADKETRS